MRALVAVAMLSLIEGEPFGLSLILEPVSCGRVGRLV